MVTNLRSDQMRGSSGKRRRKGRGNLVGTVSDQLRKAILGGELKPGDKLPSEAGLTERFGVSRTVVREAIASLKADGLVEARHGIGVFVLSNQMNPALSLQTVDVARISSIIEVLELRSAVEIEAAGLAAIRRSPAQEETILERFDELEALIAADKPTSKADLEFHLAIADASNNPRFREFLEMMGRNVIPRASLQEGKAEKTATIYLDHIQKEHQRIAEAISAQDEDGAREAMRQHLKDSTRRYRQLIRGG